MAETPTDARFATYIRNLKIEQFNYKTKSKPIKEQMMRNFLTALALTSAASAVQLEQSSAFEAPSLAQVSYYEETDGINSYIYGLAAA